MKRISEETLRKSTDEQLMKIFHDADVSNRKEAVKYLSNKALKDVLCDSDNDMRVDAINHAFGEANNKIAFIIRNNGLNHRQAILLIYLFVMGRQNIEGLKNGYIQNYITDIPITNWISIQCSEICNRLKGDAMGNKKVVDPGKQNLFRNYVNEPFIFAPAYLEMLHEDNHLYHSFAIEQLFSEIERIDRPACNLHSVICNYANYYCMNDGARDKKESIIDELTNDVILKWCSPRTDPESIDDPDNRLKLKGNTINAMCAYFKQGIRNMCIDKCRKKGIEVRFNVKDDSCHEIDRYGDDGESPLSPSPINSAPVNTPIDCNPLTSDDKKRLFEFVYQKMSKIPGRGKWFADILRLTVTQELSNSEAAIKLGTTVKKITHDKFEAQTLFSQIVLADPKLCEEFKNLL